MGRGKRVCSVSQEDINFQDIMGSTVRSFQIYVQVSIERESDMDDVVFAQAARYAIVHSAAIADGKFFKQLKDYENRHDEPLNLTVNRPIAKGDRLQFTSDEVLAIGNSMLRFVSRTADAICTTDLNPPVA